MATLDEPRTMDVITKHWRALIKDPLFVNNWRRIIAAFGINDQSVWDLAESRRASGQPGSVLGSAWTHLERKDIPLSQLITVFRSLGLDGLVRADYGLDGTQA